MSENKEGDLRVWWIPQIPMEAFTVNVPDIETGVLICDTLANYDKFQFDKNVKPGYYNAGGIQVYEEDGEGGFDWFDAYDEDGDDAW